jgi:hypothetical protein
MKILVAIILIALLSFVGGLYLPWWSIAIAAFVPVLLIPLTSGRAFLAGFAGVFLLWFLLALWIDVKNQHILSKKIAEIFPLGGSSIAIILVTAVIGGLVGGLGATCASFLRNRNHRPS